MAMKGNMTQRAVAIVTCGDRLKDEGQQAEDGEPKGIKTWALQSVPETTHLSISSSF